MRKLIAKLLVPLMKITGFHFSKEYRWGSNSFYRFVYRYVDTVGANWMAHGNQYRKILDTINKSTLADGQNLIIVETMEEGKNKYRVEAVWTPLKQNYTVNLFFVLK